MNMSNGTQATWTNGKQTVTGRYKYYRPSDAFFISLDKVVGVNGERRKTFRVYGECEFGRYKLALGESM